MNIPSRAQALAQMADHSETQITASHESWTDFLKTAARLYKYPYHEKLMIYERWAKVFNLKQMAQTVNYLTEHNLLEYDALAAKTASATARYNELSAQIKAAEKRLAEIAVLKTQIINYAKARSTYVAYRKAAKKALDELNVKKFPTVKSLRAEYAAQC